MDQEKYNLHLKQLENNTKQYLEKVKGMSLKRVAFTNLLIHEQQQKHFLEFLKNNQLVVEILITQKYLKPNFVWQMAETIDKHNFYLNNIVFDIKDKHLVTKKINYKLNMALLRNYEIVKQKRTLLMARGEKSCPLSMLPRRVLMYLMSFLNCKQEERRGKRDYRDLQENGYHMYFTKESNSKKYYSMFYNNNDNLNDNNLNDNNLDNLNNMEN